MDSVTVKKCRYSDQAHTCISGDLSTGTKIAGCERFLLWIFSSPEVFFSSSSSFSTQRCFSITSSLFSWLDVVASVHSFCSIISLSSSASSEDVSISLFSSSICSSSSSSSSFHLLFRCAPLMLLIFVPKSPFLSSLNILQTIQNKTVPTIYPFVVINWIQYVWLLHLLFSMVEFLPNSQFGCGVKQLPLRLW